MSKINKKWVIVGLLFIVAFAVIVTILCLMSIPQSKKEYIIKIVDVEYEEEVKLVVARYSDNGKGYTWYKKPLKSCNELEKYVFYRQEANYYVRIVVTSYAIGEDTWELKYIRGNEE